MSRFRPAGDVEQIAQQLIEDYHLHLEDVPIVYLYRERGGKKAGEAKLISGLNSAVLALHQTPAARRYDDIEFRVPGKVAAIVIAEDYWRLYGEEQRIALVDHELSHLSIDDDDQLVLRDHDIEEFAGVVARHGAWSDDLRRFARIAGTQLHLFTTESKSA